MANELLIIRPGALGDVLAARAVCGTWRAALPTGRIVLLAPGERGALLARPGLADLVLDLERAAFLPLFAAGAELDSPALAPLRSAGTALAFMERTDSVLAANLRRLGCRQVIFHPARPDENGAVHIHAHLATAVEVALAEIGLLRPAAAPWPDLQLAPEEWEPVLIGLGLTPGGYTVFHPGSGGRRKNWPLEYFAELGRRWGEIHSGPILITSGEADGDLGAALAAALPGARHWHQPRLAELAAVLATAAWYVGNDSGVSHLAASAVAAGPAGSRRPRCLAIFGPTRPEVWAPGGWPPPAWVRVPRAPEGRLDALNPAAVLAQTVQFPPTEV